jgi:hypothetical protein
MKFLRVGDSSTVSSSFEGSNSWQLETEVGSAKRLHGSNSIIIYETYRAKIWPPNPLTESSDGSLFVWYAKHKDVD